MSWSDAPVAPIHKALAYSFLGANTVTVIQFASTLVIARLLTPAELGVYSVAAVFIGVAAILRDFGVASYLIQVETLSREILRAALGLAMLTAAILGGIILVSADSVADFYHDHRVRDVLQILALNFFITPFGSIALAVARRSMRFRALAALNVLSTCVSVGFSITLLGLGFGPVGLAWGAVAGTVATFLMSLTLRTSEMPLRPSLKNSWQIASFGSISAGSNILSRLNVSASDLILGKLLGMEAVGLFSRATSLNQFVNRALGSALNPVLLPWLSQLKRQKRHPGHAYRKVVELTTGVTWPIFAVIAVFSEEFVLVLFGSQWGQSAQLVPYLCASAGIVSAYTVCSSLYLSAAKPSAGLIVQSVNLPVKVAAVVLLAPDGLQAVAAAWPWIAAVGAVTHQILIRRVAGIEFSDTLEAVRKSLVLGVTALATSILAKYLTAPLENALATLGIGLVVVIAAVTVTMFLINHPLAVETKALWSKVRSRQR